MADYLKKPAPAAMPYSIEIEAALLGALLRNNKVFEKIVDISQPSHFYHDVHRIIFTEISKLVTEGLTANEDTLAYLLKEIPHLDADWDNYLQTLANNVFSMISVGQYAKTLASLALKRELILINQQYVEIAQSGDVTKTGNEILEEQETALFELAEKGEDGAKLINIKTHLHSAIQNISAAIKRGGGISGISTGFYDIDKILGGLHKSDLIILAARPSMGKTALALNIAYNVASKFKNIDNEEIEGGRVAVFSLEMSAEQLTARILSGACKIASDDMRRGNISARGFSTLARTAAIIDQMPIFIDQTPAINVAIIRQRARRLMRRQSLDLIVIDYLQLMKAGGKYDGRVNEITSISQGLKALAKELDIPVLVLSQLSRAVEQRDPPIPQLSDLRDSGAIEQDADVVMFLYRAEYYLERKTPEQRDVESDAKFALRQEKHNELLINSKNKAVLSVQKQRHGAIGEVALYFEPKYTLFENLEKK